MRLKKMLSLFMAMLMCITLLPINVFAESESLSPILTKTAEWVDQETGLAKITMTAKGTPVDVSENGTDVLLVLDVSSSMNDHPTETCGGSLAKKFFGLYYKCRECKAEYWNSIPSDKVCTNQVPIKDSRWDIAQEAVDVLVDQIIPNSQTANRMGVVLFSCDSSLRARDVRRGTYGDHARAVKKALDFTNEKSEVIDACNYNPSDGTDYTGALQKAYDLIDSRDNKSRPVYLVFLSDGVPGSWVVDGQSGNWINSSSWNGASEINDLKSDSDDNDVTIYTVGFDLDNADAIELLESHATDSAYSYNISDGSELSGLFTDIGETIESGVTVWDTIDSEYFTLAKEPETNHSYTVTDGTVQCTGDKKFVWNLDNFSEHGETLEIYIQLKNKYMNKSEAYPTNEIDSAYAKYIGSDGAKSDLPVSETDGSSAVPTLNARAKSVKVKFNFVGENKDKASFNTPAQEEQTVELGKTVIKPSVTVADGYKITDWYLTADCTGSAFDFDNPISHNNAITLSARVDKNMEAKKSYTVDFYKNGTKTETVSGSVWAGEPTITVADAIALGQGDYSKYTFEGAEVGETEYKKPTDTIVIPKEGNTVIEVYYTSQAVELTFQRGDYGKFIQESDKEKASVIRKTRYEENFSDVPVVTPELGYKAVGWYEAGDKDEKIVSFPQKVTVAKTYVMKYEIDETKKFGYTVNRYIKGTTTAVPGLSENQFKGEAPLGTFDWTNEAKTTTGYKLVTKPLQPTSMPITSDPSKNIANVYYEVDDSQTLTYRVTYRKEGDTEPFKTSENTVLVADSIVAYDEIEIFKAPEGFEFKHKEFGGKTLSSSDNVTIDSSQNEIKVVYKKIDGMWFDVIFLAGERGTLNNSQTKVEFKQVLKGNSVEIPKVNPEVGYKFIGWRKDGGTALIQTQDLPKSISQNATYTAMWAPDNATVSFEITGEKHGAVNPDNAIVQKGQTTTAPTVTADKGYVVDGWYTDEGCQTKFGFTNPITADTKLYAKVVMNEELWAKVTFNASANGKLNNGTADVDTVVTDPILIGEKIGRVIPTTKPNEGFEFENWYKMTEIDGQVKEILETPTETTEVTGNLTYLAKFSKLLQITFEVDLFKAAEGTLAPDPITGISRGTSWNTIESKVPTTIIGKVRKGVNSHDYEFAGWSPDIPVGTETIISDLTFKAKFNDIYTFVVEHADIDEDGVYPNKSIAHNKKKPSLSIDSKANYPVRGYELAEIQVFIGRAENEASGEDGERPMAVIGKASLANKDEMDKLIKDLKDGYGITLAENGTLSGIMPEDCIWIKYGYEKMPEYTVEYVTEGTATDMPDNITARYKGDEITITDAKPKRDGYDFGGWKVVDDVVTVTDSKFTMPDHNVKLSAIWIPNEEVWKYTVEHYLEGSTTPFSTASESVLKRAPEVKSIVLNAPQGYKLKEYQFQGDPTNLPISIEQDGHVISVIYEKNDLVVRHVYGTTTVYDTAQSKADVEDGSIVVNAVNSGRYTRIRAVTVNGVPVVAGRSITVAFSEQSNYEVVFEYRRRNTDSGDSTNTGGSTGGSTGGGSDFGETVTILEEEVPLADGLNMINHFAYIFGYNDGTVKPMNKISREEVAAIFYRLLTDDVRESLQSANHSFPDVSHQRWSNASIATLSNGGIIAGYPDGGFKPGNAITRGEFAVMVSKFDSLSKTEENKFKDIENHWAKDFINSAAEKGWISGYPDGTFHPDEYITRAEAMTLINSVLNRKVSKEGLLENARYWSDNPTEAWYYEAVMEATNSHDYTRETPDSEEIWTAITEDKTWN